MLTTRPKMMLPEFKDALDARLRMFQPGHSLLCRGLICSHAYAALDPTDLVDSYIIRQANKLISTARGVDYDERERYDAGRVR